MTRQDIKLLLRRMVAALLFYSGINALYRWRRQTSILMYHRVIDSLEQSGTYIQPGMYVTLQTFEMQMHYLKKRYDVIPLAELVRSLQNQQLVHKNACVITFDDGWHDTYLHAFPILKKYDLPASVFLVSDYVGTNRWFWPDRLSYLLAKYFADAESTKHSANISPTLERTGILEMVAGAQHSVSEKIDTIIERMKNFEPAERDKALYELEERLSGIPVETSGRQMLSWNEVNEMSRSRVSFGSHTKSHVMLTQIPKAEAMREIVESKAEIERRFSLPCWAFCYPNGDVNPEVREMVRGHYMCAVTTQNGGVRRGDDLSALKRIGIHNDMTDTKALFACRISGILGVLGL